MKKNLANNSKKCREGIIAHEEQMKEEENVKNVGVIGLAERLLRGEELTLEHLIELGRRIAKKQGYNDDQIIVCDVNDLSERLELCKNVERPIFGICQIDKIKFVFCILISSDKNICLFRNFLGIEIPEEIKNVLYSSIEEKLEFKLYAKVDEIKSQNDLDILSLKVVETMMNQMKTEDLKKKNEFIEGFNNPKKSLFQWFKEKISKLRDQLFSLIQEDYEKIVGSDLDQLAKDSEFKEAIKRFISNIPLLEEVDNFKEYQKLLTEFANMNDNEENIDPVKFEELQKKVEKEQNYIRTKAEGLNVEISVNDKGKQELEIIQKFPEQMAKFTRIFELLMCSEIDEKLDDKISEISEKLELDCEMLKGFFRAKKEEYEKDNELDANENSEDIDWSYLPEYKAPCKDLNEKSLKQLLKEIQCDDTKSLEDDYKKVKDFSASWRNKNDVEIKNWAIEKKGCLSRNDIHEALAVMDRANGLATGGHELRDTQILALIVFLRTNDRGQLSQIQTGEGKTTIVAILAAIKALQGNKVDVITSNPVLAADGVKDKKLFFNLLSLSVTTNNFDPKYTTGERSCYKRDIVYGSIANFQFDYLKESFLGLGTRAGRPFDTIILDEVDSMIIDNANHIAKLSGPFPGMDALKYVYIKIWQELHKAERKIIEEMISRIKELQQLPYYDETQENIPLEDMEPLIISEITQSIKASNPTAITLIPSHIREYADASIDRWITNAIEAKFTYMENQQYVIRNYNGELVVQPVDYANTGITMKNTIWQHGLHQFLQLKHNLQLTSESLTSCFISNLGYIKQYGSRIYGLTGTLGSKSEQELLSSIYNVGFASIPTYKEKKFEELEGEVVNDEIFSQVIAENVINEVQNGRSCLIISETIKDAKEIQEELIATGKTMTIRTFFDEENVKETEEELSPGEVVTATNIAGRGKDFKTTDKLEENGGLHVIVTFLPSNKRVEDQAFGRTARQGNKGTAKLIVKQSEIEHLDVDTSDLEYMDEIKEKRDSNEKIRIQQIKNEEVLKLNFQDNLFECFAELYRNLKNGNSFKIGYQSVLDDLRESWAFWLEKKNFADTDLTEKDPKEEFEDFKSHARATIKGQIKFNPYYAIQQAETFLSYEKYSDAEEALNHAISLSDNPKILHGAYMKLFEVEIEKGHVFRNKCKQAVGDLFFIPFFKPKEAYKEDANKYLIKTKEAIKNEMEYVEKLLEDEDFGYIIVYVDERKGDASYWYSDDDINKVGTAILKSINFDPDKQFKNRLTLDLVEILCKECKLQDEVPIFICYNIGGTSNKGGGVHWVAMCIVKVQDQITIFYKDSKGDFGGNISVIKEEFTKHLKDVDFIHHPGVEQYDETSCGPMALENLRVMAKSIKNDGLEEFKKKFQNLTFCQQRDVSKLRKEFLNNMPNETESLFIKHITSRLAALNLNMEFIENLIEKIDKCEKGNGVLISVRAPDYIMNLKPKDDNERKIKNTVMDAELIDLANLGTNTIYDLKVMYKVCSEVITGAQIQIGGGLGLIATGVAFPPAHPVVGPIAGTMITEGVCDIALELINQSSDGKFNKAAYIKGKVISYGISLVTMGISAAMQCPKILNKAKNACKWMAETLRKSPYLKSICENVATLFVKLEKFFEKMEVIAKFNKMSDFQKVAYYNQLNNSKNIQHLEYLGKNLNQINQLQALQEAGKLIELTQYEQTIKALKHIAVTTAKGIAKRIAQTIIITNIVTLQLSSMMEGFKSNIRNNVKRAVENNIESKKLKCTNQEELQKIMQEIRHTINYETFLEIFGTAISDMLKNCSNWRIQICTLAIDQCVSWVKVYNFATDLCKKINEKLKSSGDAISDVDELRTFLTDQITEEMYSHLVSTTINTCREVSSVGYKAFKNYKKEQKEIQACLNIIKEFKNGGVAGQEQARALSDVLKHSIYIYEEDGNVIKIGELNSGNPIEIDYYAPKENNPHGHYVPHGKNQNWSGSDGTGNNCFFEAVGHEIDTDANKLRDYTVYQMEKHPRRYIAYHYRQAFGSEGSHIFMEGGRNHHRMYEDNVHYPSHMNRLEPSFDLNPVIAELRNKLNELKKKADKFIKMNPKKQKKYKDYNKSYPKFGNNEEKEEMMMGAFRADFDDGSVFKRITVSGTSPFSDRQPIDVGQPQTFEWTTKDGYIFEDPGDPKGKVIYDVYNRCETNQKYNKHCCAQKFGILLAEHMKKNPHLKLEGNLKMNESWYKPGRAKFKADQVIMDRSCELCVPILPFLTGKFYKKK